MTVTARGLRAEYGTPSSGFMTFAGGDDAPQSEFLNGCRSIAAKIYCLNVYFCVLILIDC